MHAPRPSSRGKPSLIGKPASARFPLADESRPIDRATRPFYAVWEVTLRCDLACRHCSSRAGRARDDELTTPEALDLVAQLAELGVEEITLIGGEAYLRDDWLVLVAEIRKRAMRCTMVTGGRSFTGERAKAAADAGLQSVSVSVDGMSASHDVLRGVKRGPLELGHSVETHGARDKAREASRRDSG